LVVKKLRKIKKKLKRKTIFPFFGKTKGGKEVGKVKGGKGEKI